MKKLEKLNLNILKNKKWYHQRFDGCPLFISFIANAEVRKEKRKPKGTEADVRVCFFESGSGDWYLDMKDVRRGANAIVKLAKKDPNISKKLLRAWKKDEDKFQKFYAIEFPKVNLNELDDNKLLSLWKKQLFLGLNRFTSSSVIDHFALGTDEMIDGMLKKELKGKFKSESEFTRVFSIATAPVHQSFINLAEIDLLKILLGKSKETLKQYQNRYYWTKNNYFIAQNLSIKHFQDEIKAWKKSNKDLNEELRRIEQTPVLNKKLKLELFKEYKFSRLLKTLLKVSEDFTYWQDERKRATYHNIDIGTKVLTEIGRRVGYSLLELKNANGYEIETIIKKGSPTRKELRYRNKQNVFIWIERGFYPATGDEMNKIKNIVLGKKKMSDVQDFRGLSASTGKAIGRVKIVRSATEIRKVKQGDILVAVMTRPDYVMAMKKAAAIVTNEGGITSHAAIVSRELGIPCIIGTKIATEVLKDGDLVEVNANHGWVRKLIKNK
jgi:phosphohistidine swiveling domain-containing protein